MKVATKVGSVLVMGALMLLVAAPQARAQFSDSERKCLETIAKAGGKFVKKKQTAISKCNNKNIKEPGDCPPGELAADIAALVVGLNDGIGQKCGTLINLNFANLHFPGKCTDANPGDGFTLGDVKTCIHDSHEAIVDDLIAIEYGAVSGPITDSALRNCQSALAKNGGKFTNATLKAVQKCRNGLNKQTLSGFAPRSCSVADSKTLASITKAESKARAGILDKCTDAQVQALDICNRPECAAACGTCTKECAADCIIDTHGSAADNSDVAAQANLINYEYADALTCGDGILNSTVNPSVLDEECDAGDDAACVGQCGSPTSDFPCLCLTKKRQHIIEHEAGADSDNGWTGISHDQKNTVETGGFTVDLYECDNVGDFDCIVGPNCTVGGAPCANDAECGANGPCRKERTAVGPHCNTNVQTFCDANSDCLGVGNYCIEQFHGSPLPLSAGGVSVCVVNVFTDDVTGTLNLQTGSSSVAYRQDSRTRLGLSGVRPCPVCGGFCDGPTPDPCDDNADCAALPGAPRCVTDFLCSAGPNVGRECRPSPPFGGVSPIFGTTSVDCPPSGTVVGIIDLQVAARTTGNATLLPGIQCDATGFTNKVCINGANNGRPCTDDSECPGGTCSHQCFCPGGGVVKQKPNGCDPACLGGGSDGSTCSADSDCPGGFCHPADCRENLSDPDGAHEGACTSGPLNNLCSTHSQRTCNSNVDCQPPACPFCDVGETCVLGFRNCYENEAIIRDGVVDPVNPTTVAANCLPAAITSSVNQTSGLPGPGAHRWIETRVNTGF